jgi:hypothetical protein
VSTAAEGVTAGAPDGVDAAEDELAAGDELGAEDELAAGDELAAEQPAMSDATAAARPSRRRERGVCMTAVLLSSWPW